MAEGFDTVRAPQFVDFTQALADDNADVFFDRDEEIEAAFRTCPDDDEGFYSPFGTTPAKENSESNCENGNNNDRTLRRSLSVGNLELGFKKDVDYLCNGIVEVLDLTTKSEEKTQNSNSKVKEYCRPHSAASGRHMTREHINRLAQPKKHYTSSDNLHSDKFISAAELINNFQNKTPKRFRSRPKLNGDHLFQPLHNTVPHSPALLTKQRTRPQQILSHEEREQLEFKKQQKFKIKANPISKKVLQGPLKPVMPVEKHCTKPEPFALTVVPKKVVPPSPKRPTFHARPAPRLTPKKVKEPAKEPTIPQTPSFMKEYEKKRKELNKCEKEKQEKPKGQVQSDRPQKTLPQPFSFEERDQLVFKKKERMIQKVLEEEKKLREFHARPVPKCIAKKNNSSDTMTSIGSSSSNKINKSQETLNCQFKAKPATVLHKEPFIPLKTAKPLTEINDFHLYTELRAEEREKYEQEKREKEERLRLLLEEEERLRLEREAEEIARIRKEAQHKAQPVKKYKEFVIQPSGKVTQPISPKFMSGKSNRNKENECQNNKSA